MGNIAEHGSGFGDTRLPSDDEDYGEYVTQPKDQGQYTYRNGVNYVKNEDYSIEKYGSSNIPKSVLMKYFNHYQRDNVELERIWEAYQSLLVQQAIEALQSDELDEHVLDDQKPFGGGSNLTKMISTRKLYEQGRNYMNNQELEAIAKG